MEEDLYTISSKVKKNKNKTKQKENYSCFRKCGWREKFSPGWPQISFFRSIFRRYLFSFLGSFAFFNPCFVCLFVWCFLKIKMYLLIHIWVIKKLSPGRFPRTRLLFLASDFRKTSLPKRYWMPLYGTLFEKMQVAALRNVPFTISKWLILF